MKNPFKDDLTKLKKMTFKQKYEYIWGYYKWGIVGIIFAAIFIFSIVKAFVTTNRDAINVLVCDQYCEDVESASQIVNHAFTDYLGDAADKKDMVNLDTSIALSSGLDAYTLSVMQQKLTAQIAGHTVNIMLGKKDDIIKYGTLGAFVDLKEILDSDTFRELQSQALILTATVPEDDTYDEPTPEYTYDCAIDISKLDNQLLKEAGFTLGDDTVLAIPANADNEERAISFVHLLLGDVLTK